MSAQILLDRLDGARSSGPGRWRARCPAHQSRGLSLAICETDAGVVLVRCFAECDAGSILRALGLEFDALYPPRTDRGKPIRNAFPARQRLECISLEALVVQTLAEDLAEGRTPNVHDMQRLRAAVERIQGARDA